MVERSTGTAMMEDGKRADMLWLLLVADILISLMVSWVLWKESSMLAEL